VAPEVTVIQDTVLDALQAQPAPAVTVTLPVPLLALSELLAGVRV
jgi:hypothetical protein